MCESVAYAHALVLGVCEYVCLRECGCVSVSHTLAFSVQCVAVCCNVLQCVAMCCSVLQCIPV